MTRRDLFRALLGIAVVSPLSRVHVATWQGKCSIPDVSNAVLAPNEAVRQFRMIMSPFTADEVERLVESDAFRRHIASGSWSDLL